MSITKGKVGLILLFITSVQSYVYDLQQPLKIHHGEKKAFGYSMDFIKDYSDTSWLFVGAPKDSVGGTLNACNLKDLSNLRCGERLPNLSNANQAENFTDQLLGVSVTSTTQVYFCSKSLILQKFKYFERTLNNFKQCDICIVAIQCSFENFHFVIT